MTQKYILKRVVLILLPLITLIYGFLVEEDLSTGGSKLDFIRTFPAVVNFSNFIFDTTHEYTRHFPLHYFFLSIPHFIFKNIFITKLIYFLFSLFLPFLVYLNIQKLYTDQKFNSLIIAISLLFLPFYRSSSIWPNAHLTALIFLLTANYFFIISLNSKNFIFKFMNILFLSFATYSMQSYVVFFIFYLISYFKNTSLITFLSILFICFLFSLPGFFILLNTATSSKLDFSNNFSYTIITNFSIVFFCFLFFLVNSDNFNKIKKVLVSLNKFEIILLSSFFLILLISYENLSSSGGGFFYKVSNFIFNNNLFFYFTSFAGLTFFYLFYKIDKNIFYTILLINFSAIGYATSQKYFEPILIILIFILNKNFFSKSIITNKFNSLSFYAICLIYFFIALVNDNYDLSRSLIFNN